MASGFKAYPFDEIEPRWQACWEKNKTFRSPDPNQPGSDKPKFYVLDMFPYPSASGLHVGHLEGYTATDIIARYKRMRGFNVLHPMGWDAFGLPAEQHAIDTGTHPNKTTSSNIQNFTRQIKRIGFSYDWDREINTTDSAYYCWTQWIFLKLYEKGLAYEAEVPVNWCPALGTVLANEEVIDGKSERGGHPVVRKPMRQWVLKITAYAERLLKDLDLLDWSEPIKEMQRNWIGKSVGAEVVFVVADGDGPFGDAPQQNKRGGTSPAGPSPMISGGTIPVFTTRPDTLFGATYMVLAPEHPLVPKITTADQKKSVADYVAGAAKKSDLDRTDLAKDKTGVFTGAYAVNPVNQKKIPIWIADYVLMTYGTGAIMAVPAHDERDWEFAEKYGMPILEVIRPNKNVGAPFMAPREKGAINRAPTLHTNSKEAFTGIGTCVNSTTPDKSFSIDGLQSDIAKEKITAWLAQKGIGKKSIQYKLRDWLFSRQRYWGEPIPIIHCKKCGLVTVPESELPLRLPDVQDFKPAGDGKPPLSKATEWVKTRCPKCHGPAERETNTMPQWAGSCWYYLAFVDPPTEKEKGDSPPKRGQSPINPQKEKYWMNVDLYVGGAEHAVLHLLYSRFWHKVLYDLGVVSTPEPFQKLVNQGMILGEDNQKMSKSRGNVVNPDEMVERFGADSLRMYEMFMGPLEMTKPWSNQGVEGVYRFLGRVWRLFIQESVPGTEKLHPKIVSRLPTPAENKRLHQAIKKVTEDLEGLRFNTAISALMIFVNETLKDENYSKEILEKFLLLLAPFAPHMAEELWQRLGHSQILAYEAWPTFDPSLLIEDQAEMAVLIGGKVRAKITVSRETSEREVRDIALADSRVKPWVEGKEVAKVIVVPGRTVNIVVK